MIAKIKNSTEELEDKLKEISKKKKRTKEQLQHMREKKEQIQKIHPQEFQRGKKRTEETE